VVFVAAALTDLLDGYVARRHGLLEPARRPSLDPMADKLLLVVVLRDPHVAQGAAVLGSPPS